ncbi:hypothetical protein DFH09DRAFT_1283844 [Mycena vulgaris]|nr:hypothetical protein DFH09DRAFT_1283844 [Mycena vulgaris]
MDLKHLVARSKLGSTPHIRIGRRYYVFCKLRHAKLVDGILRLWMVFISSHQTIGCGARRTARAIVAIFFILLAGTTGVQTLRAVLSIELLGQRSHGGKKKYTQAQYDARVCEIFFSMVASPTRPEGRTH